MAASKPKKASAKKKAPAEKKASAEKKALVKKSNAAPAQPTAVTAKPYSRMRPLEKRILLTRHLFGDHYSTTKITVEKIVGERYESRRYGKLFASFEVRAGCFDVRLLPAEKDVADLRTYTDRKVAWIEEPDGWWRTVLTTDRSEWLASRIGGLTGAKTQEMDLKKSTK